MVENSEAQTKESSRRGEIRVFIQEQMSALRERTIELADSLLDKLDSVRIKIAAMYSSIRSFLIAAVIAGIIFTPMSPRIENNPKYIEKKTGRVDTAYVFLAGTDIGTDQPSISWRFYFNHLIRDDLDIIFGITGDNYRRELEAGRLRILSGVPFDYNGDKIDDRVVDISKLSTEQLAEAFEKELQQVVSLAQQGEVDEVMIFINAHGGYDENIDWVAYAMNLLGSKLFENTLYEGLKGLPENIRVRVFLYSCNSEALVVGKLRFTDIVSNSTVFYLTIEEGHPSRKQASNYLSVETLYDRIVVDNLSTSEEVPDIRPSGSIEQVSSTFSFPYVRVVDMVRNTTKKAITYTIAATTSVPGYTVTVPSSIVVNPNDSRGFSLFIEGGDVSVTQFLTATVKLAASNGVELEVVNTWDNPYFWGGLVFSPEGQPGSYRVSNHRGNRVYHVMIPITNTLNITQRLIAEDTTNPWWGIRRQEVVVPPSGIGYIHFVFMQRLPIQKVGIGIFSPSGREIKRYDDFNSELLFNEKDAILPFVYRGSHSRNIY